MKKTIIIASAIIAGLYALTLAGLEIDRNDNALAEYISVIMALSVTLISSQVIFNIKQTRLLRISLLVVSILMAILFIAVFSFTLFDFISGTFYYTETSVFIIWCVGSIAIVITSITYIIRALKSASQPADKTQKSQGRKIDLTKTILIIIGIAGALIIAAGIMWYNNFRLNAPLIVSTHIMTVSPQDEANIFSAKDRDGPLMPSHSDNELVTPFVVSGGKIDGDTDSLAHMQDIKMIEELALNYINRIPDLIKYDRYRNADAELQFSSDRKLARYKITLYESPHSGKHASVTFRKNTNGWSQSIYITTGGFFSCSSNYKGSNKSQEEIQKAKEK